MNIKSGSSNNQPSNVTTTDQPITLFKRGPDWRSTLHTKVWPNGAARKALGKFYDAKREDPRRPASNNDTPFSGGGHFSSAVPGLSHYHVTQNLSLVYRVIGNTVYLYGFYNHGELGTGQPRSDPTQKMMATQFKNTTFTESVDYASMLHRILVLSGTKVSDT